MKITKETLRILLRIVVGCMPPQGKEKRRNNEAFLVKSAKDGLDVPFHVFRSGLKDGPEMYDKIADFADSMGKKDIDAEVVLKYFGNQAHVEKTYAELTEAGINKNSEFALHTLFAHSLIPVEIVSVNLSSKTFDGVYTNSDFAVLVRNIMFFGDDEKFINLKNNVFVHFPLFVSPVDDSVVKEYVLKEQLANEKFMHACRHFCGSGLDHKRIIMYCNWITDSMNRYNL